MEEKEIRGLGKKESGENDPVFPEENAMDPGEEMIAAPNSASGTKPFRPDADKTGGRIPGNMPDREEKTVSAPDGGKSSTVFGVPDFVRFAESYPDEQTDTGTMLLSETEKTDTSGEINMDDEEDMTIDPNATTISSPLEDTDLPADSLSEKDKQPGGQKKNGNCSFDPGMVFAPGGNLDAIRLSDADAEESAFSSFPDMQKDKKKLISELAFEQETGEDGSAFNLDAADIFKPGSSEPDFDFVSREDESEDGPDRFSGMDAETHAGSRTDPQEQESGLTDNPDEKMQTGESSLPDSDGDIIGRFLSESDHDKADPDDPLSIGAAFITGITETPEENAEVDLDARTIIMSHAEFEEAGLKTKEKTAQDKSGDNPAEEDGDEPFDLSDDLSEILPEPEDKPVVDSDVKEGKNTVLDSFLSEPEDESVFDLDTKNILDETSAFGKPEAGESPDAADNSVFDLDTKNILDETSDFGKPEAGESPDATDESVFDLDTKNILDETSDFGKPEAGESKDSADESVFDLDTKNILDETSDFGKPEAGESPDAEDEPILELGAEAVIEAEEEIPVEVGAEAAITESEEENFDPNAETIVASAADILGLASGNLLEPPSETDTAAGDDGLEDLLIRDADEGLPDLDSILDTAKDYALSGDTPDNAKDAETDKNTGDISVEDGLSAMDILDELGSPEQRKAYGGADNTIGLLDMLNAESSKQPPEEDDFFHVPDMEEKPEPVKRISKPFVTGRMEIKTDKRESRKKYPDRSAETLGEYRITPDKKDTGYAVAHTDESEPVYDSLAGKYYFSLSPAQIESAIERIINRVFSERIEKVLREVVGKAVEEEMKKFRDGIMEDIAEGDKL